MRFETKNLQNKAVRFCIVLSVLLVVSISAYSQSIATLKVSIDIKDKKLVEVFKILSKDHKVNFVYDRRHLPLSAPVTYSADNQPLDEVVQAIIAPFQLEFAIYGRQISIYRKINQKFTISGYLKDAESDEALIGANIYESGSQKGTVSNQYGFFSLTLSSGEHQIVYSYLGYKERRDSIPLYSNIIQNIKLKAGNQLTEIVVVPRDEEPSSQQPLKRYMAQTDAEELNIEQVNNYPALLGENDVLKSFTLLPGIQSGNEGDNGISVRGGGRDQNLVLMDGAPIYNAYHLFGFVSLFNPEAVHKVQFYKSGFPSRYSGRLSSVMDIQLKDGNMKKFHGGMKVGLLSAAFTLEGPIVKDKLSIMATVRRPFLDLIFENLLYAKYAFIDNNFKVAWKLNERNRIHTSWYIGNDEYFITTNSPLFGQFAYDRTRRLEKKWGNKAASVNWSSILSPKLFSNVSANYSNYSNRSEDFVSNNYIVFPDLNPGELPDFYSIEANSFKSQGSLNLDFQYNLGIGKEIKFGSSYQINYYNPLELIESSGNLLTTNKSLPSNYSHNLHFYVEANWNITNQLRVRPGVHLVQYSVGSFNEIAPILQPRLLCEYQLTPKSIFTANYTRMNQFDHYLSDSGLGFPTDLWVPSFKYTSEIADQVSVGYKQDLPFNFKFELSGYYKTLQNLLEYKPNASYYQNGTEWVDFVETGRGKSRGAEIAVSRSKGRTTGWVSYTLSSTERQFTNINKGNWYPYRFDKRHDLSIALNHKLAPRVEFGAIWIYNTGNPVTLPTQQFTAYNDETIHFAEEKNNYRNPTTHRLDVSFNFHKLKINTVRTWTLGCYNTYGRFNPYSTIFDGNGFKHTSLFRYPFVYVAYKINF